MMTQYDRGKKYDAMGKIIKINVAFIDPSVARI
jgi:hypothetical protein